MFRPNRSETINDINERDSVFTIYNTLKGSPAAVHINTGDKKANIDRRHNANLFKLQLMPAFKPEI